MENLHRIAKELLEREILTGDEIDLILNGEELAELPKAEVAADPEVPESARTEKPEKSAAARRDLEGGQLDVLGNTA
jgi:hypothetical protein